ncbi:S6 family peptidase [Kosakonia sp. H7A]|uniref:S6 family peptidase n=1 Tax=Kosakonia sp. H7A TaxID=2054598 RepID=UPI001304CE19|nr:S6 family peptidase [Kosakonia sp. H7A]
MRINLLSPSSLRIEHLSPFVVAILPLLLLSAAEASIVRDDIDYQTYRDFAENKGQFIQGAQGLVIRDKDGRQVGVLQQAPMPDFSAVDRLLGVATLISPQYITSVRHNGGYQSVQFGGSGGNPDYHRTTYTIVTRNDHPDWDVHVPRLNKLVTEVVPQSVLDTTDYSVLMDRSRFTTFYRVGTGTQDTRAPDGTLRELSGAYNYLTGGTLPLPDNVSGSLISSNSGLLYDPTTGPLGTYGLPGDSGSPLYAWDSLRNTWVIAGVLSYYMGIDGKNNLWTIVPPDYIRQVQTNNTSPVPYLSHPSMGDIHLTFDANSGRGVLAQGNDNFVLYGLRPDSPGYGRDLTLYGGGRIVLDNTVNQDSGSLTFDGDWTVAPRGQETWVGGGIITAPNSHVTWQVNGLGGDSLHKLGTGTLLINAVGINPGELSAGDGTVILNQQMDSSGHRQAFSVVDIVSGRPVVVLGSADQVNPDNIYFGFRGGRLDLNGNNLNFHRIRNVDNGAQLVNHSSSPSLITVTGYSLEEWAQLLNMSGPYWQSNQHIFQGMLGENDAQRLNGPLSLTWSPTASGYEQFSVLALTGGAALNGDLSVSDGTLLLSGSPVLHAGNVILPDDWRTAAFSLNAVNVANNASFHLGEYASLRLRDGMTAGQDAMVILGFRDDDSPARRVWRCYTDDNTGSPVCSRPQRTSTEHATLPTASAEGNITLGDRSQLLLGKTVWSGALQGTSSAGLALAGDSLWQMTGRSQIGSLLAAPGSIINMASSEGRELRVGRLEASGLTVLMGASPQSGKHDQVSILQQATGSNNILDVRLFLDNNQPVNFTTDLLLASAPLGTVHDYFSLPSVNRGFSIYTPDYRVTEQNGEVQWVLHHNSAGNSGTGNNPGSGGNSGTGNNPGSGGNSGTGNNPGSGGNSGTGNNPGSGGNSGTGNNPDSGGNSGTGNNPDSGGNSGTGNNPGSGGNSGTGNNPDNGWFIRTDNEPLIRSTRVLLASVNPVLLDMTGNTSRRTIDLFLSENTAGSWVNLSTVKGSGNGQNSTWQSLDIGVDTQSEHLLYGLSASAVKGQNSNKGTGQINLQAGSLGVYAAFFGEEGFFADTDLKYIRLSPWLQPDPLLEISPGRMDIDSFAGRIRIGWQWRSADGNSSLLPWAAVTPGYLIGSELAGQGNGLKRESGEMMMYGTGLDARHLLATGDGTSLVLKGGVSRQWVTLLPGVELRDQEEARHYDTPGYQRTSGYVGFEGKLTTALNISLEVNVRDDGRMHEKAGTAGFQLAF